MKTPLAILEERNEYLNYLDSISIPSRGNGLGYVSVFCGGGGLDLGFASAGFKPLFSSDLVPAYCDTVHKNLGKHIVEPHDISELSGKTVTERLGVPVDMVIGGPPCQSFSILGSRKSTDDPRGQLVYEYARFIHEIKPKAFLFENVPGRRKCLTGSLSDRVVVVNTELTPDAWQIPFLNDYLEIGLICATPSSYCAIAPEGARSKGYWLHSES
jgi:hypothetical protein